MFIILFSKEYASEFFHTRNIFLAFLQVSFISKGLLELWPI